LVVKTTPGETQVYLNDELKGMTSPEGEIRLPDLPPATYRLRVSLPGYQSFERPMTVEAGEAQTVYVTLVQKSAAVTPSAPQTVTPSAPSSPSLPAPSYGIPVPGVKISGVRFFEGPHDKTLEKPQRVYRFNFERSSARSIYWELDLSFPKPAQRIDFQVDALWFKPDGSQMARQTISAYVLPEWGVSWHTLGWGYNDPGHWARGTYRVDFYYGSVRIASGSFQID
jgi:hypothetical protein